MSARCGRPPLDALSLVIGLGSLVLALVGGCSSSPKDERTTLRFWAMGREGEVVQELMPDFERENPDIRVVVQQVPWTAAHEKMLTAHVGRSTPDAAQLGNTWVAEFAALRALESLEPWLATSTVVAPEHYFAGIWDTNVIDGTPYGVPWYVDTRVLFYRKDLLSRAGYETMPETWPEWREAMRAVKAVAGPGNFAILLPSNEWTQPVIFGLQAGSPLISDNWTRGAFSEPEFRDAYNFYIELFREGLAPPYRNNEVANLYQEFGRGAFSMYITGPWNLGEFRRRLPPELQDSWATAPLPGPDAEHPGVSLAGGSSLVVFKHSKHKGEAWRLVEYLSRPEIQLRFLALTGDLPAREEAWADSALTRDPHLLAFRRQLERVVATPKIPEWEMIAIELQNRTEAVVRGVTPADSALTSLDRYVDRALEKRRWLVERKRATAEATAP